MRTSAGASIGRELCLAVILYGAAVAGAQGLEGSGLRIAPAAVGEEVADGHRHLPRMSVVDSLLPSLSSRQRWSTASWEALRGTHRFSLSTPQAVGTPAAWPAWDGTLGASASRPARWQWRYSYQVPVWHLGNGRRWDLLWRYGQDRASQGPAEHYWAIGVAATGLIPFRPDDRLDIRLFEAPVRLGATGASAMAGQETSRWRHRGLALSYDASVARGVQIGADVQWTPPGFTLAPENTIWFGLRAQLRF